MGVSGVWVLVVYGCGGGCVWVWGKVCMGVSGVWVLVVYGY